MPENKQTVQKPSGKPSVRTPQNNKKMPPAAAVKKKPKKKKMSGGAIFSIFLIILLTGFAAMTYFDLGGVKATVATALNLDDPTSDQVAAAEAKIKQIQEKQDELNLQQGNLVNRQQELEKKGKELEGREQALADKEKALIEREAAVIQSEKTAEQVAAELKATVEIFEQMDAKAAAKTIGSLESTDYMAALLLAMKSDKAAGILNQMNSKLSTEILSAMMSQ